MNLEQFRNALCILTSIDAWELEGAGVIQSGDHKAWASFSADPLRWFLRLDDRRAGLLFGIIERRQVPKAQAPDPVLNRATHPASAE